MRVKKYPNKQKNSAEIYNYSAVKDAKIHLVTRANGFLPLTKLPLHYGFQTLGVEEIGHATRGMSS